MKGTRFEFVINVSQQGKDKIEFTNKFLEAAALILWEINDSIPRFCLVLLRHIHNPVNHITWSVLQR